MYTSENDNVIELHRAVRYSSYVWIPQSIDPMRQINSSKQLIWAARGLTMSEFHELVRNSPVLEAITLNAIPWYRRTLQVVSVF